MAFHDIAKQLESSHVQVVEWKSPTGDMQFKRSSAKTEYEKLEMQFVNQFFPLMRSMWILRPKSSDEEEKENIKLEPNSENLYFDSRGAPAPVPWENETRAVIDHKPCDRIPPAIQSELDFIAICNELVKHKELLHSSPPILIPSRNQKHFPAHIGLMRFDCDQKEHWFEVVNAFKFLSNESNGLDVHMPSTVSLEEVLREAYCMDVSEELFHMGESELFFTAVYNHFLPSVKSNLCKIVFNWRADGDNMALLEAPNFIVDQNTTCKMTIGIDTESQNVPHLKEIRHQFDILLKILSSIKHETELCGKRLDLKTVQTVIQSGSGDVSSDIWKECHEGQASDVCAWINCFIQSIKGQAGISVVADGDDTVIANRIMKAQNHPGMMRKVLKDSALDMLADCGERHMRQLIEQVHSVARHDQLSSLLNTHWSSTASLDDLQLLLELNYLGDALDKIKASSALFTEACTKWIKARKFDPSPLIELQLLPVFGWTLSKGYHPSEWYVRVSNYVFALKDTSPTEKQRISKKIGDQKDYFVFEKTAKLISH